MKQIKNIKEFIETEYEDGYVIHITFDELIAIEVEVEQAIDEIKAELENIPWANTLLKHSLDVREVIFEKLTEIRRNEVK